jgi:hypothetical protein
MSFFDWVKISTAVDIATLVFVIAFLLKFRNLSKQLKQIREDLDLAMENPAVARRTLKNRKKTV